jgi:hypothetical protein
MKWRCLLRHDWNDWELEEGVRETRIHRLDGVLDVRKTPIMKTFRICARCSKKEYSGDRSL